MVTNFNACPLGLALADRLGANSKVILVSQDASDHQALPQNAFPFTARIQEEEDRNRLVAFLKQENMKVTKLIHNQPFMLKPTAKEEQFDDSDESASLREQQKRLQRVDELKDKIRTLVETPLFFNSDMLNHQLIAENARILQLIHKQHGLYSMLRASQLNQRKCLQKQLEQGMVGLSSFLPGLYEQEQAGYMQVGDSSAAAGQDHFEYLDLKMIAELIVDELLNEGVTDQREYVRRAEWNVYEHFEKTKAFKQPEFYKLIQM
ncbi:hypothetical protein FGO68_gene9449 [Halteria grandinella]|uniref:Uncharacterized protein n=1 Tax=Halteria grandinella TaxID=5974 RepID=A0A8J8T5F3_HALGN|nr:hypothetical protein FGO68_gene9449 [Halteria grandinella]